MNLVVLLNHLHLLDKPPRRFIIVVCSNPVLDKVKSLLALGSSCIDKTLGDVNDKPPPTATVVAKVSTYPFVAASLYEIGKLKPVIIFPDIVRGLYKYVLSVPISINF